MEYNTGERIIYLTSDNEEKQGTIENINSERVQICTLNGSLFIGPVSCILYSLGKPDTSASWLEHLGR